MDDHGRALLRPRSLAFSNSFLWWVAAKANGNPRVRRPAADHHSNCARGSQFQTLVSNPVSDFTGGAFLNKINLW